MYNVFNLESNNVSYLYSKKVFYITFKLQEKPNRYRKERNKLETFIIHHQNNGHPNIERRRPARARRVRRSSRPAVRQVGARRPAAAWAAVGVQALHRPAPRAPRCLFSVGPMAGRQSSACRATVRTRASGTSIGRAVHPTGHCKNTLSYTISGRARRAGPGTRGREKGGGVRENAFPDECKAQAVRAEGRVHAMMDIVLISIWPLLPYCSGAGRHRSLHPRSPIDAVDMTVCVIIKLLCICVTCPKLREISPLGRCIRSRICN